MRDFTQGGVSGSPRWVKHGRVLGKWLLCFFVGLSPALADEPLLDQGAELDIQVFTTDSPAVAKVLWVPSEHGVLPQEVALANQLAEQGIEVSMPNVFESYFLPAAPSSLRKIPTAPLVKVLQQLLHDRLPVWVVSSNEGAALAVKMLAAYQAEQAVSGLGLVLLNPNLYVETPEVGQQANYWPALRRIDLPVYVMQAELSPWRWRLAELQQQLKPSGSAVFLQVLPQVRDRFYFRPDALPVEQAFAKHLVRQLMQGMGATLPYLTQVRSAPQWSGFNPESRSAMPSQTPKTPPKSTRPGTFEGEKPPLKAYRGQQNLALQAPDLKGVAHRLSAYRGKVVLVNFWASWCPPCVHEMPSMARLKEQLGADGFEILAVNLAEEKAAIEQFVQEHPVNFPILLDPKGAAVKDWRVFAYPSSYVLDKQGRIRFALFGGHEWDDAPTVAQLKTLLEE